MSDNRLIEIAEAQICIILRDLEVATGQTIESIQMDDVEITTVDDVNRQWLRRVSISLFRIPGSKWA